MPHAAYITVMFNKKEIKKTAKITFIIISIFIVIFVIILIASNILFAYEEKQCKNRCDNENSNYKYTVPQIGYYRFGGLSKPSSCECNAKN